MQHELGIYLRAILPKFKVQFERNILFFINENTTIKKEIDITIFTEDKKEKYAIELKCPLNGQYPEQMYSFVKDIRFMEELKERGFTKTACVVMVSDKPFYEGKVNNDIYKYFKKEFTVYRDVYKPTGATKNYECISLSGRHQINWRNLKAPSSRYYIIEI